GGVDSSVAAALLKKEGYDVSGVIMEIFDESTSSPEGTHHACFGPGEQEDIEDARNVAEKLGIPFYTIDLKKKYRHNILDFFVKEFQEGNTPNPCVKCNHEMKFGAIIRELEKRDIAFDYFATGHYAKIKYDENRKQMTLRKAADLSKDQSYFLFNLPVKQLERTIFPLGDYKKDDVRELAKELTPGLSQKAESQDFIAGGYHQLFGKNQEPGPILNRCGDVIGQHKGIVFYTIGQRRGLGIGGGPPLYVIAKDKKRNAVIVGGKEELLGTGLIAGNLNWLTVEHPDRPVHLKARIRFLHKEADAEVGPAGNGKVLVKFQEPQSAITPGQAVVFYDGDVVAGGGIIEKEVK
ncbi:MAG: tRNA 2-thiouridine(34) synthase MnmA, partial [bacterium]|nr:tRNA 2-thiouridine(34) synthase MnmA [bacterium]